MPVEDEEHSASTGIELPTVESVESRDIDWVWPGRLARGMFHLCDGDPEKGKSQISCDIAARWTNPRPFPFSDGTLHAPGNVLMAAAEDAIDTTTRPRLEACGANLKRVRYWPELIDPFTLPNGIDRLAAVCRQYDIGLLILDPIGAYLADDINANRDSDVRRALRPLVALAQETNMAVLAVRHLNKDSSKSALYRGGGSIAFTAAARIVWAVGPDPVDPRKLVFAVLKSNVGIKPPALSYSIEGVGKTSRIRWEGESMATANDILGAKVERGGKSSDAATLIADLLASGPKPAQEVEDACAAAGFKSWSYRQARKQLGIKPHKMGMSDVWMLALPEDDGFED